MTSRTFDSASLTAFLAKFKAHIRITSNDFDTDLTSKLKAAILVAEHEVGMTLAKSTFKFTAEFPVDEPNRRPTVVEAKYPLISVDDCYGVELEEEEESHVSIGYEIREHEDSDRIDIILDYSDVVAFISETVVVYTSGFDAIPEDIEAAILLIAAKFFNNPVDSVENMPTAAKNLLRPYRSWGMKHDGE